MDKHEFCRRQGRLECGYQYRDDDGQWSICNCPAWAPIHSTAAAPDAPKRDVCANCGETYDHHMKTTQCYPDSEGKWFPKSLADVISAHQAEPLPQSDGLTPVYEVYCRSAVAAGWDFWVCREGTEAEDRIASALDDLEEGQEVRIVFRRYTPAQMSEVVYE